MLDDSPRLKVTRRSIIWCTSIPWCLVLGVVAMELVFGGTGLPGSSAAADALAAMRFHGPKVVAASAWFEPVEDVPFVPFEVIGVGEIEPLDPEMDLAVYIEDPAPTSSPGVQARNPSLHALDNSYLETFKAPVAPRANQPTTLHGTITIEGSVTNGVSFGIEQDGEWAWYYLGQGGDYNTRMVPWTSGRVALVAGVRDVAERLPSDYIWLKHYGKGAALKLDVTLKMSAVTFAMTVQGGPAGGMAMSLDGVLSDGARCRFRPTTDAGGRFRLDMPECSFSMKGEHLNHGSISKWSERISNSGVRPYSLTPLVVASGHAIPRDLGAHFVAGTQLEFVRTSGGPTPVSRRVGFNGQADRRTFRIEGLLPGIYRVTLFPGTRMIRVGGPTGNLRPRGQKSVPLQSLNLMKSNEAIVLRR